MRWMRFSLLALLIGGFVSAVNAQEEQDPELEYDRKSKRIVPRDRFPVLDNPDLLTPEQGETTGAVKDRDFVIGIEHNGEAKAYPVPIMGIHELANDTIGGLPVAVSW